MWITVGLDEGFFCCTNGETLGQWCSQYESIGVNVGLSFFITKYVAGFSVWLPKIPVARPGLMQSLRSWHSICKMSAICVSLTGNVFVVTEFGVDAI